MAQVYNRLTVDLRREVSDIVTAVQKDANSRFLDVYLKDNGLPIDLTGHKVRFYGKKYDGTEIYNDGSITEAVNGRCQFELTDQALAVAQDLEVQIVIYYNTLQILQSLPFKIKVVKSLISEGSVESSNEYGALVVLYQNLYEAYDLMTTMVQSIGVPKQIAQGLSIDTMWDAWEYLCNYVSQDLTNLIQNALTNNSVDGVIQRLGETSDTGGTVTTGSVFGKLNNLIDFNGNYAEIQKMKSSSRVTVPPIVSSGTQQKVSFGIEFETPVKLDYIRISISGVVSGYGDRSGLYGKVRVTYCDNSTRLVSLVCGSWKYQYYLYQSAVFDVFCNSYGDRVISDALTTSTIPSTNNTFVKKIEVIDSYTKNYITEEQGKCDAILYVYYRDIIKVR